MAKRNLKLPPPLNPRQQLLSLQDAHVLQIEQFINLQGFHVGNVASLKRYNTFNFHSFRVWNSTQGYCAWNSILSLIQFKNHDEFETFCTFLPFSQSGAKLNQVQRICKALRFDIVDFDKFVTLATHAPQKYSKSLIIYANNDSQGHIFSTIGPRISGSQAIARMENVQEKKEQVRKPIISDTILSPPAKKVGDKKKYVAKQTQASLALQQIQKDERKQKQAEKKKHGDTLPATGKAKYHYLLRQAKKMHKQTLPVATFNLQNQKDWAYYLAMRNIKTLDPPKYIGSQQSYFIASKGAKDLCEDVWVKEAEPVVVDDYSYVWAPESRQYFGHRSLITTLFRVLTVFALFHSINCVAHDRQSLFDFTDDVENSTQQEIDPMFSQMEQWINQPSFDHEYLPSQRDDPQIVLLVKLVNFIQSLNATKIGNQAHNQALFILRNFIKNDSRTNQFIRLAERFIYVTVPDEWEEYRKAGFVIYESHISPFFSKQNMTYIANKSLQFGLEYVPAGVELTLTSFGVVTNFTLVYIAPSFGYVASRAKQLADRILLRTLPLSRGIQFKRGVGNYTSEAFIWLKSWLGQIQGFVVDFHTGFDYQPFETTHENYKVAVDNLGAHLFNLCLQVISCLCLIFSIRYVMSRPSQLWNKTLYVFSVACLYLVFLLSTFHNYGEQVHSCDKPFNSIHYCISSIDYNHRFSFFDSDCYDSVFCDTPQARIAFMQRSLLSYYLPGFEYMFVAVFFITYVHVFLLILKKLNAMKYIAVLYGFVCLIACTMFCISGYWRVGSEVSSSVWNWIYSDDEFVLIHFYSVAHFLNWLSLAISLLATLWVCYILVGYRFFNRKIIKISGFIQKKIDAGIQSAVPKQTIIDIHSKFKGKIASQDKSSGAGLTVSVRNLKKYVSHTLTGKISRQANTVFQAFGRGFSDSTLSKAGLHSGGHPILRASCDDYQAGMIERCCSSIFAAVINHVQRATPIPHYRIVDVGSKFSKMSRVIQERMTLQYEQLYGAIRPTFPENLKTHLPQLHNIAKDLFNTRVSRRVYNLQDVIDVLDAVCVIAGNNYSLRTVYYTKSQLEIRSYIALQGHLSFHPVRPRENAYDQNYYRKESGVYARRAADNAGIIQFAAPFQGKIQDFNYPANGEFYYFMFDVHYYLQSWRPTRPGRCFVVGGQFFPMYGTYQLPGGEGRVIISSDNLGQGHVKMITRSSTLVYDHDLVTIVGAQMRTSFGWYSHVAHDCDSDNLTIQRVLLPKMSNAARCCSHQSIQGDYLRQALGSYQSAKGADTYKALYKYYLQNLPKCHFDLSFSRQQRKQVIHDFLLSCHDFRRNSVVYSENKQSIVQQLIWVFTGIQFGLVDTVLSMANFERRNRGWNRDGAIGKDDDEDDNYRRNQHEYEDRQMQKILFYGHDSNIGGLKNRKQLLEYGNQVFKKQQPKGKKNANITQLRDFSTTCEYFYAKPTPTVQPIARYVTPARFEEYNQRLVARVNRWLQKHPKPVVYKNDALTDFDSQCVTTKTGWSFATHVVQYEWSAKIVQNAIYALFHRHLACDIQPDRGILHDFTRLVNRVYSDIFPKFLEDLMTLEKVDIIENLKLKNNFDANKKIAYFTSSFQTLKGASKFKGSFMTMVKSGEVNYSQDQLQVIDGFLLQRQDRPRNIMVPSDSLCGLLVLLQGYLWAPLKRVLPGFIQGLTKTELKDLIKKYVKKDYQVISLDGSAFDSTQNSGVMDAVDNAFFERLKPFIHHFVQILVSQYPKSTQIDIQTIYQGLLFQATTNENLCFTKIPEIEREEWPEQIWRQFLQDWGSNDKKLQDRQYVQSNYIYTNIKGTTFSGHPTKTTLGNTLRSLMYAYFYLDTIGVRDSWKNPNVFVIASGDDVCLFVPPKISRVLSQTIMELTSRQKRVQGRRLRVGLGQVIKKVQIQHWTKMDFCSKISTGSGIDNFNLYRDVHKLLTTKMYYSKKNSQILAHPALHCKAILEGLQSEKISHLLEDLLSIRLNYYQRLYGKVNYSLYDLSTVSDKYKFAFSDEQHCQGYADQDYVNDYCGISIATLLTLSETFVFEPQCNYKGHIVRGLKVPIVLLGRKTKIAHFARRQLRCNIKYPKVVLIQQSPKLFDQHISMPVDTGTTSQLSSQAH